MIQARHFQEALHLETLVPPVRETLDIRSPDTNRPGMQFCGYYAYFAYERPQVIGKVEMSYLEDQSPKDRIAISEEIYRGLPVRYGFFQFRMFMSACKQSSVQFIIIKHQIYLSPRSNCSRSFSRYTEAARFGS